MRTRSSPFRVRAHGLGELFQAEDTDRVIEQAYRRARWTRRHLATVTGRRTLRQGVPADAEQLRKFLWTLYWPGPGGCSAPTVRALYTPCNGPRMNRCCPGNTYRG